MDRRVGGESGGALYRWDGRITTKHPSDVLLAKMCQVARVLDAWVQGDDGECYDARRMRPP